MRIQTSVYQHGGKSCLLLLVYLYWGSQGQPTKSAPSVTSVTVGGSFQFPFTTDGSQSYRVQLWFNSTVLITAWVHQSPPFIKENYKGRVKILGDLIQMDNLQLSDSGFYDLYVDYLAGKQGQSRRFCLQVFEPVSKPNITAECLDSNVTLACNSSQGTNVEYVWETAPPCAESCLVHRGPVVEIVPSDAPSSLYYTCTAQNEFSNETSDPLELKLCSTQPAGSKWTMTLCIVISVVLLTGAVICIQIWRKTKTRQQNMGLAEPGRDGGLLAPPAIELQA